MGQAVLGSDRPNDHKGLTPLNLEADRMSAENRHREAKLSDEAPLPLYGGARLPSSNQTQDVLLKRGRMVLIAHVL